MIKIKKISIALILAFIVTLSISSNIYARGMRIDATSDKTSSKDSYKANYEVTAGSYIENVGYYQYTPNQYPEIDVNKHLDKLDDKYIAVIINHMSEWPQNTIRSFSVLLQNKEFTNYNDDNDNSNKTFCYYDYGKKKYEDFQTKAGKSIKYADKFEDKNDDLVYKEFPIRRKGSYIFLNKFGKYLITVYNQIEIDPSKLNSEIKKLFNKDGYVYMSEPVAYHYNPNEENKNNQEEYYHYQTRNNKRYGYLTAAEILKSTGGIQNFGSTYSGYSYINNVKTANPDASLINYYDNILYLPKDMFPTVKVYINHVDKDGNKIDGIENSCEKRINGDVSTVVNNDSAIANKAGYQEYYEMSTNDTLNVTKSAVSAYTDKDGKTHYYEYSGKYKLGYSNSNLNDAKETLSTKNSKGDNFDVSVKNKDSNGYVVVNLVYDETPTPPPTPNAKVIGFSNLPSSSGCDIIYTPTDEDVTPYIKTSNLAIDSIKFKKELDASGNFVWNLSEFKVKVLYSGILNNDDSSGIGNIFGAGKQFLFSTGNSEFTYSKYNEIINKLKEIKNSGKLNFASIPSKADVEKVLEDNGLKITTTSKDDFSIKYHIDKDKYNGVRRPKVTAKYKLYDVMSSKEDDNTDTIDCKNELNIFVYNPVKVNDDIKITTTNFVDHSTGTSSSNIIQKNADFTVSGIKVGNVTYPGDKGIVDTSKYLNCFYVSFDFSIELLDTREVMSSTGDSLGNKGAGTIVKAGDFVKLNPGESELKAKATSDSNTSDIVSQVQNNMVVIAMSDNMPSDVLKKFMLTQESGVVLSMNKTTTSTSTEKYINTSKNDNSIDFNKLCDATINKDNGYKKYHDKSYYNNTDMYEDSYYFAKKVVKTKTIGRIYDFKITDCSDIDFKSTFRKSTTPTSVNDLTGIRYFSGIKEFKIFNANNNINELDERTGINIGNSVNKTILPLGPYKNTSLTYVSAPKMGYRISFDLKTSGYYDYASDANSSKRVVKIVPTYYYISKDGGTYIDSINLYYKNSQSKYVNLNSSPYTISFKPNDGYRYLYNKSTTDDISNLSSKLESLTIGGSDNTMKLTKAMMSTSGTKFIQAWYGEFKLPNSTIAVKSSDSISNPLSNGYVGVKFDIQCIDVDGATLSYGSDNKNANPKTNTSQWDYEGYLGFNSPGSDANGLSIQLEKGTWSLSKDMYKTVKGTVVFFDLDNRAANDFD